MRNTNFTDAAWSDYLYWQGHDGTILKRINRLIEATKPAPFEGIGKPEPLREALSGCWSRRIDDTHRLVYEVSEHDILILACRYHY